MQENLSPQKRRKISLRYLAAGAAAAALLAALSFGSSDRAEASAPPAGATIGGIASATYTDQDGVARQVVSNLVVTTVKQVFSHTLVATQTKHVAPGGIVDFPLLLSNTGNGSDTYTISSSDLSSNFALASEELLPDASCSGSPSSTTAISGVISLAAGQNYCFIVRGTAPAGQAAGDTAIVNVGATGDATDTGNYTASSTNPTSTEAGATLTAAVQTAAVMKVTQSLSKLSGAATNTITVTIDYTNTGGADATNFTIVDTLGTSGTVGSTAFDASDLSYAGSPTLNGVSNPAEITASGNVVTAVIPTVAVSQSGRITFDINVSTTAGEEKTKSVLAYSDATNTTALASNLVEYLVSAGGVVGVTLGDEDGLTGTTTSSGNNDNGVGVGSVADSNGVSDPLDTNGNDNGVVLALANQGAILTYELVLTNTGDSTDTFNLSLPTPTSGGFSTGTTFTFVNASGVPLIDSNGDGSVDSGPIAAQTATKVYLEVQRPANSITGGTQTVTATSATDATATDSTTISLTAVTVMTADLTFDSAGGPGAGFDNTLTTSNKDLTGAIPDSTATFTLWVANTGFQADSYNLSAGSTFTGPDTLGALPTGWSVVFTSTGNSSGTTCPASGTTLAKTGSIAAGGACEIKASVRIPAGETPGSKNVYFMAFSPVTGAADTTDTPNVFAGFDLIYGTITVDSFGAMSFQANGSAQAYVGGSIDVAHQLCNTGNQTASSIPTIASTHTKSGWTNVVVYDANGNGKADSSELAAGAWPAGYSGSFAGGECANVVDRVFTPLGAGAGENDTIDLTASGTFPAGTATEDVTDFVTVISGDVSAVKQQQVVDCITQTITTANWTTDALPSQAPGTCIAYLVTATNIGSQNATGLKISDTVPAYTSLVSGSVTNGGTASTTLASSTAPDLSVTAATLTPGQTATMGFIVQINK